MIDVSVNGLVKMFMREKNDLVKNVLAKMKEEHGFDNDQSVQVLEYAFDKALLAFLRSDEFALLFNQYVTEKIAESVPELPDVEEAGEDKEEKKSWWQ